MCVTGDDAYIANLAANGGTVPAGSPHNDRFVIFANENTSAVKFRTCYGTTGWTSMTADQQYAMADNCTINGVTNALVFDNSSNQKWYQDGGLRDVEPLTASGKTVNLGGFKAENGTWTSERTCQVAFGATPDVRADRYFSGNVKGIRIYKDALTPAEIAQNAAWDQEQYYTEQQPQQPATIAVPQCYATDGLVFFVDANLNTGLGYDANATKWVDLTDATGATTVDVSGKTWGTDSAYDTGYLAINNGYIKLPDEVRQAIASGKFTIEFLMSEYEGDPTHTASGIANIMALTGSDRWIAATTTKGSTPNDNFVIYQYGGSTIYFKTNGTPNEDGRATVQGGINDQTQTLTYNSGSFVW
jgi:hypothetical protein